VEYYCNLLVIWVKNKREWVLNLIICCWILLELYDCWSGREDVVVMVRGIAICTPSMKRKGSSRNRSHRISFLNFMQMFITQLA